MPDLLIYTQLEILIYTQKFCYAGYANYPLFSKPNLIEIKHLFLYPTFELAKLSMGKDYVSLAFIKSKFE